MINYPKTILQLGIWNVITVLIYRIFIRIGFYKVLHPVQQPKKNDTVFIPLTNCNGINIEKSARAELLLSAEKISTGFIQYFSNKFFNVGLPPNWFLDPIHGKKSQSGRNHWSVGRTSLDRPNDIKIVWEASRFDWALVLAKAYIVSKDEKYINTLNKWIINWRKLNWVNSGHNWECGQETSIRLMHLLLSAYILDQYLHVQEPLVELIKEHCERINSTISYAVAQNNNHGTSEAAALYVGGAILIRMPGINNKLRKKAIRWYKKGKTILENRVDTLILNDGSFSQYSTNYHRLLLDTLNIVEFWRQKLGKSSFSDNYYSKVNLAINWLFQMTNPESGNVPNMGGNDGARLFVLTNTKYRDYRSTIQLSVAIFNKKSCYDIGPWDESFVWLDMEHPKEKWNYNRKSKLYRNGGYAIIRTNTVTGIVRFPNYNFRPSNCDGLHLDLWNCGRNVLRDGGSYCYSDSNSFNYFSGNITHNTVQFNSHNQMPLISKFLFGSWIKCKYDDKITEKDGILSWRASYKDYKGFYHRRTISVEGDDWSIIDELNGDPIEYVIRWRLAPGEWEIHNNICNGNGMRLIVDSDDKQIQIKIADGYESLHYLEKTAIPVFEVKGMRLPATINTIISFEV